MSWYSSLKSQTPESPVAQPKPPVLNYETPWKLQPIPVDTPYRVGNTLTMKGGYFGGIRGTIRSAEKSEHGWKLVVYADPRLNRGMKHSVIGHTFVTWTDIRDRTDKRGSVQVPKLAMPVMDAPSDVSYYDLGHENYYGDFEDTGEKQKDEKVWLIDKNWEWDEAFAGMQVNHFNAFNEWEVRDKQYIARGRYAKNRENPNGIVSVVYGFLGEEYDRPRAFEYKKNRVIAMIEQHYGSNVVIHEFGKI